MSQRKNGYNANMTLFLWCTFENQIDFCSFNVILIMFYTEQIGLPAQL